MVKNYKRVIIYSFMILFIAFIVFYCYPRKIYRECSGIIYRLGDSNYSESVNINIDGYYSEGLFSGDTFEGTVAIGDQKLTNINMKFDKFKRGHLFCYDENGGEYISYGDLFTNNKMKDFTIIVVEEDGKNKGSGSWTGKDGLMISAPASNRGEALEISKDLMKDVLGKYELK